MIILLVVVGLLIAGAFLVGPSISGSMSFSSSTPKGTRVRTETMTNGDLVETIKAPGRVEPHTKVDISAEVAARIEDLPFREGAEVKKGDVVVKLDDRELRASLQSSEARRDGEQFRLKAEQARLNGLQNSLIFAKKQLDRQKSLSESGDVATKMLDDAEEKVADIESNIASTNHSISNIESSLAGARADIARAEDGLAKTVIKAPMDGVITALNAEVGEVVLMGTMNNPGTVIMTVADLSRMILDAEVAESDIARVKLGQSAKVRINAYRDQVYGGTVTEVALQRTENKANNTGYFKVEVEIDTRGGRVLSGCLANVDIEIETHKGMKVESQAIVDRLVEDLPDQVKRDNPLVDRAKKTAPVVYRMQNNQAVCTPVKRGASDDTHSIVLDGLHEGDVVIVGPFKVLEKLKHDEAVVDEKDVLREGNSPDKTATADSGVSVQVSP